MRTQGWEVVDEKYDDFAESSETLNRPAMQKLLDEIAYQRIDRVIVTRLDRISRRLQDTCEFMEYLRSSIVAITIASQPEIGGDAQGRLLINLMASFAQFEQDMTRSSVPIVAEDFRLVASLASAKAARPSCFLTTAVAPLRADVHLAREFVSRPLCLKMT